MKTIILTRHADIDIPTAPGVPDLLLPLNAAGQARAADLARIAGGLRVTSVFTSPARRTRDTAAPLAAALSLHPTALEAPTLEAAAALFATRARDSASGPVVLIVGHSNTVPQIVQALGAPFPGPAIQGFDDLFVVTLGAQNPASAVRLKYGAQAPAVPAEPPAPPAAPAATAPTGPVLTDRAGRSLPGTPVAFDGPLFGGDATAENNVSGVTTTGEFLLLVSDEMKKPTTVQVMKRVGEGYAAAGTVPLPDGDKEVDAEGIAAGPDGTVYVTGSHSWTRKIENGVVHPPEAKKARNRFFQFRLKPDGTHGHVRDPKSLRDVLVAHPVLGGFTETASKENGIDIEGLAFAHDRLHFGFRGPVLRDEWVPVLSCTWDDPTHPEVRYLRLGGRGVRDLVAVPDGFLVLAGPVGDGDLSYRIYFWDGKDQLPAGDDGPRPELLGEFSNLGRGKPEGLAVLGAEGKTYDVLVVCDGVPKGGPVKWALTRS